MPTEVNLSSTRFTGPVAVTATYSDLDLHSRSVAVTLVPLTLAPWSLVPKALVPPIVES